MISNKIDFAIPASEMKEVMDALELIISKLSPYLITDLTRSELDGHARLGKNSYSFVSTALACAAKDEKIIPGYTSLADAQADKLYYDTLLAFQLKLESFTNLFYLNTEMAGIELVNFSNEYYYFVKRLSAAGETECTISYNQLSPFYSKSRRKVKEQKG